LISRGRQQGHQKLYPRIPSKNVMNHRAARAWRPIEVTKVTFAKDGGAQPFGKRARLTSCDSTGGSDMNGIRQTAVAGALMMAAGLVPAPARAQSREPLVRAFEIGRGSRIGATVQDVDNADVKDAKQARSGVVVETVAPGGPAEKAGLKSGDTITEFDGEKVRSVRQFSRLVQETPAGRSVPVTLSRGGQRSTVTVTVERQGFDDDFTMRLLETPMARPALPPTPPAAPRAPRPPSVATPAVPFDMFRFSSGRRLGVTIEALDDQLAEFFGVKDGVLVKSVSADSAAQKAGVKAGDVITSINGRKVYDGSDVNRAIDRMEDTDEFTLEVMRDHKTQTLKGKLEPRPRRGTPMD
jgi:serine protease Do